MRTPKTGRPSIFRYKKHHIHGKVSDAGKRAFERHRMRLEKLVNKTASHGDVIEYLALGPAEIRKLVQQQGGTL